MPFASNPYDALKGLSKYLRQFRGKTFVIKLGGEVLDEPESRRKVVEQIGVLWTLSIRVIVVHGGGARLDQLCGQLKVPVEKHAGRRVTTPEVLDAAKMVFNGVTNTDLLAEMNRVGVPAVGLTGVDAGMIKARKRAPIYMGEDDAGKPRLFDYGLVGDIEHVDPALLKHLLDADYVPVIAPLSGNPDGSVFNTNADTIAAQIAQALGAEKLFYVLRVPGLLKDVKNASSLITFATLARLDEMEARGELSGGMLPKVASIRQALNHGVHSVHLVSGVTADALLVECFTNEGAGTMIVKDGE
ncbi:MAG: acetylglutamate kinase [Xanthomonadales bacterium]|nr:Acetylglutamate kinase [Xanthomonadales bacterium]MCC6594237.1 acetylglutamate kinase [Xanthomonadales bacterium]MCE7930840.1 acetylglutamate kinase [Xanthomonadales bacterium PRO6]